MLTTATFSIKHSILVVGSGAAEKVSAGKPWTLPKPSDAAAVQADMHIGAGTAA